MTEVLLKQGGVGRGEIAPSQNKPNSDKCCCAECRLESISHFHPRLRYTIRVLETVRNVSREIERECTYRWGVNDYP